MTDIPTGRPMLADVPADTPTGAVDGAPEPAAPQRTRFAEPARTTPATSAGAAITPAGQALVGPVGEPVAEQTQAATGPAPTVAEVATDTSVDATALPVMGAQEPVAAPEAPRATGAPGATGGRNLVWVLGSVVLVLAMLTAFLGYQAYATRGQGPVETSRRDAVGAARNAARLVFSYDYRHLAKDFAAGRATTTGVFRDEYDKTTAKLVNDVAPRYKAVVVADVSDSAVITASVTQAVTLVFLNQSSSSTLAAQPKITQSRLELTMVHQGGHWLVSRIKAL